MIWWACRIQSCGIPFKPRRQNSLHIHCVAEANNIRQSHDCVVFAPQVEMLCLSQKSIKREKLTCLPLNEIVISDARFTPLHDSFVYTQSQQHTWIIRIVRRLSLRHLWRILEAQLNDIDNDHTIPLDLNFYTHLYACESVLDSCATIECFMNIFIYSSVHREDRL